MTAQSRLKRDLLAWEALPLLAEPPCLIYVRRVASFIPIVGRPANQIDSLASNQEVPKDRECPLG